MKTKSKPGMARVAAGRWGDGDVMQVPNTTSDLFFECIFARISRPVLFQVKTVVLASYLAALCYELSSIHQTYDVLHKSCNNTNLYADILFTGFMFVKSSMCQLRTLEVRIDTRCTG